jgi:uncharacterized membrane protein
MTGQLEDSEREDGEREADDVAAEVEFISAERLIFFSDAVAAIAMTLLAFSLPVPHIPSHPSDAVVWDKVWAGHIDYLTFLISFVVIANHWRLHHRLFQYVHRLDSRIITLNLVWLLMIVIIPFTTKLISGAGGFGPRFTVYAAVQLLTVLTFLLMSRHIRASDLLRPDVPPAGRLDDDAGLLTVAAMFAISIPVAFVPQWGQWAFALWIASAPAARAVRRYRDRDLDTDTQGQGAYDDQN